jgi:2-polyprenyl-3-methyl-5-hydroxy-6-metoxy-1,4-benzoquinol methylase
MNKQAKVPAAIPRDYDSAQSRRYHLELLPYLMNSLAGLPAGAHVLDAGCGNGFISGKLLKRGFRVLGID